MKWRSTLQLCIPNASATSLHGFIQEAIAPGSTVHTDDWLGYSGIETKGYAWEVTTIGRDRKQATGHFPRVHRIASLVKRWILGTHQGAISPAHLDYYLDEFTFRFNRRTSRSRGKLFYRLVQQAMVTAPTPYENLVKHVRGPRPKTPDHNI